MCLYQPNGVRGQFGRRTYFDDFCHLPLSDDFCGDLDGEDPTLSQSGQDLIMRYGMTIDLQGILDVNIGQIQMRNLVNYELVRAFAESLQRG